MTRQIPYRALKSRSDSLRDNYRPIFQFRWMQDLVPGFPEDLPCVSFPKGKAPDFAGICSTGTLACAVLAITAERAFIGFDLQNHTVKSGCAT
jgi:hypothetical protein